MPVLFVNTVLVLTSIFVSWQFRIQIQIFNKSAIFSTDKYFLKKVNKCNKVGR